MYRVPLLVLRSMSSLVLHRFQWIYAQCDMGYIDRLPFIPSTLMAVETETSAAHRSAHGECPDTVAPDSPTRCGCLSVYLYHGRILFI